MYNMYIISILKVLFTGYSVWRQQVRREGGSPIAEDKLCLDIEYG